MTIECIPSNQVQVSPTSALLRDKATGFKSLVAGLLARSADYFETRKQRNIDRDAFTQMLALDDETLQDIGVTRDDVMWASKLPISVNASLALEDVKRFGRE